MDTIDIEGSRRAGRGRRRHSAEFKAEVMQACRQPGVSIASVALTHGLNANLLRRWLGGRGAPAASLVGPKPTPLVEQTTAAGAGKFVPVNVGAGPARVGDIRIEMRRGPSAVSVSWPAQEAAACGAWLREWLR